MKLFALTQPLRDRQWLGYLIGLLTVAGSYAIRLALGDAALKFPFLIFLPPVILTTFFGGVRPGIATAIIAGLVADYTLIAPVGSIWPAWPEGWLALVFYSVAVGVDIALIHGMTTSANRATAAEAALRQATKRSRRGSRNAPSHYASRSASAKRRRPRSGRCRRSTASVS